MNHVRGDAAVDRALPVFPPPRRGGGYLVLAVMYALLGVGQFVLRQWLLGALWVAVGVLWAARSRYGGDFLNVTTRRNRAKAQEQVAVDPQFAVALDRPSSRPVPYEVQFEPPTRWTYVVRCTENGPRQAVAKAHLALVYREKRGLRTWVADDGVTPMNGARLRVERLPVGSPTDEWRVNYITPEGRYFSK